MDMADKPLDGAASQRAHCDATGCVSEGGMASCPQEVQISLHKGCKTSQAT